MATEDVEEFCLVSHEGDGTTHLLPVFMPDRLSDYLPSWLHDHRTLMQVDGLVHVPSDVLCHIFVDCIAGP